jgi:hypothetical protein
MAAFIQTCVNKGWINDEYSGMDYKNILSKTFNIEFNEKPFKQIKAQEFDKKYLEPFKNYPTNI